MLEAPLQIFFNEQNVLETVTASLGEQFPDALINVKLLQKPGDELPLYFGVAVGGDIAMVSEKAVKEILYPKGLPIGTYVLDDIFLAVENILIKKGITERIATPILELSNFPCVEVEARINEKVIKYAVALDKDGEIWDAFSRPGNNYIIGYKNPNTPPLPPAKSQISE